jgi:hypothetical protein
VRQHFRGFVDCDDPMAERDQRIGDPPGPAAEFEDSRSRSGRVMHDDGLAEIGEPRVELDGAAVRGNHARSGPVCI